MIKPIKFSKTGPEGWMEKPNEILETVKLAEGSPTPKGLDHAYFERGEQKITSGIWRSTPYTDWYDSYPCDEFMYILEGHVILENDDFCEKYEAGDAFLVPKGFKGYWKQPVSMLKFYVIIE